MGVRGLIGAIFALWTLALPASAHPQSVPFIVPGVSEFARSAELAPVVQEIEFEGLRRIHPEAVRAQISSREDAPLDAKRIEADIRTLSRLGWFGAIRAETRSEFTGNSRASPDSQGVRLIFHLEEHPFLTRVEYSGSRLLSQQQIEKILADKQTSVRTGAPVDPAALQTAAREILSALAELGHPEARVQIARDEQSKNTVRIRFVITDGPHLPVGRIVFEGNPSVPQRTLVHQMRRIAPHSLFAGLRGKDAYTLEAFDEDRERILAFYQNHGYPTAKIGQPEISRVEKTSFPWFPWPHRRSNTLLALTVPVESGRYYQLAPAEISAAVQEAAMQRGKKLPAPSAAQPGQAYSAQAIEQLRRTWLARVQPRPAKDGSAEFRSVVLVQNLDPATQTAHVRVNLSEAPPYVVRRIEFHGLHRFSDRFVRRRIPLEEGKLYDERALETGLTRIARTGYFRAIRKENIHIAMDEETHTANVSIRMEEIGHQRASLVGGNSAFGNTLGVAYSLFDLLNREELLSAHFEGGPQSLQLLMGLAMEGFLGSRGSLTFSVFRDVIRPRLSGGVKGPFYSMESSGINAGWGYALTNTDSLGINYGLSHSTTRYSIDLPAELAGLTSSELRADASSRSVGLGWLRDAGSERILLANSVSGGWLGGSENLLRPSASYARIFPDPIVRRGNAWTFRTTFSGVGSYQGDMPLSARLFSGGDLVRGLRAGDLGPLAAVSSETSSGAKTYSAVPAGSTLVAAANAEYRVPLGGRAEAAGFFDLGSGRLLTNWLGSARPSLLDSTNGVLHGSTGVELRWTIPGVQVPVRAYFALNVLRLNRSLLLPDGPLFRAHNRFAALGWALGSLF